MIKKVEKQAKQSPKPFMYDVIERPVITEKATMSSEFGKVVFNVRLDANKADVKAAVEALFGVKVEKVNTVLTKGKVKRFRGVVGKKSDVKKAIVTLAKGQTIDAMAGVK